MPAPRYGPAYRRSHECCLRRCRHDARTPIGEGMFREARWWTAIVKPVRPRAATWEQRYSARLCRTTDPGCAPRTPAAARRANWRAARECFSGSKCAMSGSHTTLRSCATSAGSDRTRVSPVSGATTSRSEDGSSEYASPRINSSTNREGTKSVSPEADSTAVISRRRRARLQATRNNLRSSARSGAVRESRSAAESLPSETPLTRSISASVRSSDPRARKLGQSPSCTPATATTAHSRPAAA